MMNALIQAMDKVPEPLPKYRSILLALDSSDHANQGIKMALKIAALGKDAGITGIHAYAAKLHDMRFRQMEGGLPEQFRKESELEHQRDVHDDLITRGLSIITDSYLDQADSHCRRAGIRFNRCSLEGKNYRALTQETNSGKYDLLVMGASGLGALENNRLNRSIRMARLGSVCQRVTRRSDIDTLIIKQSERSITEGPIVVAMDGSAKAYGGLITALQLAQHWRIPIKVIAVFDPNFHYVAFNRIAGILSQEAAKVFRFKEQERLHEEIIDSGLAKIYQGHLDVAQSIAREHDIEIESVLLDGKPHDAITRYTQEINPSLLVIGKLGIHADEELDIGSNAENLLHDVNCAVLLSQRQHQPHLDVVADVTTSWTIEAEQALDKVPGFVRNMARMVVLRHAQKRGHTVITEKIVNDATSQLCPHHAKQAMAEIVAAHDAGEINTGQSKSLEKPAWSLDAEQRMQKVPSGFMRDMTRQRMEAFAKRKGSGQITAELIEQKYREWNDGSEKQHMQLTWDAETRTRIEKIPGFVRGMVIKEVECCAKKMHAALVTVTIMNKAMSSWGGMGAFHS